MSFKEKLRLRRCREKYNIPQVLEIKILKALPKEPKRNCNTFRK
jgi:hypothetical protein